MSFENFDPYDHYAARCVTLRHIPTLWPHANFAGFPLELVVESAGSIDESDDSGTDFVIVCKKPVSNMFDIYLPILSACENWDTIVVG